MAMEAVFKPRSSRVPNQWLESSAFLVLASKRVTDLWDPDADCDALERVAYTCDVVTAHGEECLVLNDEPLTTTWIKCHRGIAFVRWVAADNEQEVLTHAARTIEKNVWEHTFHHRVGPDPVLFDAYFGPKSDHPYECIRLPIAPGDYEVSFTREAPLSPSEVIMLRQLF
jgi:hypothetical protein